MRIKIDVRRQGRRWRAAASGLPRRCGRIGPTATTIRSESIARVAGNVLARVCLRVATGRLAPPDEIRIETPCAEAPRLHARIEAARMPLGRGRRRWRADALGLRRRGIARWPQHGGTRAVALRYAAASLLCDVSNAVYLHRLVCPASITLEVAPAAK